MKTRKLFTIIAIIALLFVPYALYLTNDNSQSKYSALYASWVNKNNNLLDESSTEKSHDKFTKNYIQYHLIIEGTNFYLQSQKMRGISVVWLNLIRNLASSKRALYSCPTSPGPKHKLIYIDRLPNSAGSKLIAQYRHKCDDGSTQASVIVVPYRNSIDYTLEHEVPAALARYENSSSIKSQLHSHSPPREPTKVQVVYTSTYYTFPDEHRFSNLCKLLYVHDVIPEIVGFMKPGTEWWPRLLATWFVDSFIAISKTTLRDYVRLYSKHVLRNNVSAVDALRMNDTELEANTYMSVVLNRISSAEFPGPATTQEVLAFRKKYDFYTPALLQVEYQPDYLLSLGYLRFPDILLQAFDGLPDEYIRRFSLVFTSSPYNVADDTQLTKHKVVYNLPSTSFSSSVLAASSPVIRIYNLGHIERKLVRVAMTGALAVTYISKYEGFGLPIAEAFASGTLVVTTNCSSMPEVGGDVAYYVNDVLNVEELRRVLLNVIRLSPQERKSRITAGLKRATLFGGTYGQTKAKDAWEDAAAEFAAHLRSNKFKGQHCFPQ